MDNLYYRRDGIELRGGNEKDVSEFYRFYDKNKERGYIGEKLTCADGNVVKRVKSIGVQFYKGSFNEAGFIKISEAEFNEVLNKWKNK